MKWYEKKLVKITYAVFLGLLCLLEVSSIGHDRADQEAKHKTEQDKEAGRFADITSHLDKTVSILQNIQSGQNLQIAAEAGLLRESEKAEKISEERSIKIRALDLTRDIASFTTGVWMSEAQVPHPVETFGKAPRDDPAWAQWEAQLENIAHNGVAQFHMQFGASVGDIVEQLERKNGWESHECDVALARSYTISAEAQFLYVEGCAQDIQREAAKMP